MITLFGVAALTFMMLMYAFERRGPVFILGFAAGCVLGSVYGFLSGAWPFGVLEAIWAGVAARRFISARASEAASRNQSSIRHDECGRRSAG